MLLHALHAAHAGYNAIVITADDTDVLLYLGYNNDIPCPLYKKRGTQSHTRFFVVGTVARALGHDICDALILVCMHLRAVICQCLCRSWKNENI